ncbi:MAG: beta-propeller fold lactonase family protein, partial [Chloroflexi bacterium]|nr:beta-propeller fold lactonase family protein [Chloroflexota bacterium]
PNRDELEEAAPLGQRLSVIAQTMDLRQMRGEEPTDIVISPDGSRLYVPARNTDTLYVIDAGTRQVTDVVNLWDEAQHPFGPTPSRVAISSDGRYVALANQVDYSFTILDTTTLEPVGTARPGGSDMAVDVAISGQTAFGLSGSGVLSLIDLPTATVTQTVNLGREVMAMAAAPDGSAIYVSLSRRGILVLDPATGQIVRTIDTSDKGGGSGDLIISPDGARIYASAPNEDMIIAVDLTTYQVISTYEALLPEGLALNGDGSRLFVGTFGVTGEARYNLWVLDTQSGALVQGINFTHPAPYGRLVSDIAGIATAPDGSTLYLATVDGDGVVVFNTDTLDAEGIILINPLAEALPTRAVISPDGAALYVSSRVKRPATVAVIDTATQTVVDEIVADSERECDSASYGLGISPDGQVLYILASDAMCIFPVDTATQTVGTPLHIDERGTLIHMAVHPDGDRAYVLSISGTVYVVGLPDLTLETTIPLGLEDTYTIKLTPDGTRAYVTDSLGYAVLDLNTNTVLNVQQGGERVSFQWVSGRAVGLHPMEPIVYIGDFWGFDVQRTDTDAVLYRLDLTQRGWSPGRTLTRDMAFTPDGRLGYLALWDEKGVLVFDPQSRQVKARIDTGRLPYNGCSPAWLVPAPDGQTMYAVNEECDSVTVIDTTSQQITAMISLNGAETRRYEIVPVPCMINAPNVVNLRAGPGTTFEVVRQLDPSEQVEADGQTTGTDGFIWWRLTEGAWVRSDVVEAGLGCDAMPTVTP